MYFIILFISHLVYTVKAGDDDVRSYLHIYIYLIKYMLARFKSKVSTYLKFKISCYRFLQKHYTCLLLNTKFNFILNYVKCVLSIFNVILMFLYGVLNINIRLVWCKASSKICMLKFKRNLFTVNFESK